MWQFSGNEEQAEWNLVWNSKGITDKDLEEYGIRSSGL